MINRKLKGSSKEFVGWLGGEFKKGKSKPLIKCHTSGVTKHYHSIESFLKSKIENPNRRDIMSEVFFTREGGTIKPVRKEKGKVYVVCSECHRDSVLFPEPFVTSSEKLRAKSYPCICKGYKHWSDYEYQVKIHRYIKPSDFTLLSLPEESPFGAKSKVTLLCGKGHVTSKTLDSLLNQNSGCVDCAEGSYGHYHSKIEDKDYLYIVSFAEGYIKVGRSFDPEYRFKSLKRISKTSSFNVVGLFSGSHKHVWQVEQYLHKTLTSFGYYHKDSLWTIESFSEESLNIALNLIKLTVLKDINKLLK